MPYQPLQLGGKTSRAGVVGTMPVKGVNKRDLPQFLDPNNAQYIENYLIYGQGSLKKRGGLTEDSDTGSTSTQDFRAEYRNNLEILAYDTNVKAYDRTTGTFTTIKSDFTSGNGGFDGDRYGDYFFVTNKIDGLWRISRTITYEQYQDLSGQNVFIITNSGGTIGATITGVSSGETATVVSSSGTTTLTVVVSSLSGNFTHNEAITSGTLSGATLTNINPVTTGELLNFQTSGASAVVLEDSDAGATGTLTLGVISGTIQSGEVFVGTGDNPGQGTTTGTLIFAINEVTDAPGARYCKVIGDRLLLYQLKDDESAWRYSDRDTGDNPPFTNFTIDSGFNDPGGGTYRNGLTCNTAEKIGNIVILGFDKGWTAFSIEQTTIGSTLSKYDQPVQTSESGIQKLLMTEVGLIACGTFGVKRLVSLGQLDIPYSEQWEALTEQLGEDFFDDADFTDAAIDYDFEKGYIFVSYAKDASANNYMLAIKAQPSGFEKTVEDGATSFITGWNVKDFLRIGRTLYGTSSLTGKTYKLFDSETDDGSAIYCQYLQEVNFGTLSESFDIAEFYASGFLTSASTLTVSFDRYTRTQRYEERKRSYTWNKTNTYASGNSGWGASAYGSSSWGGGATSGGLVEDFTGANVKLRSNMRVLVRFESNDYSDHTLTWFSLVGTITTPIRRRSLTLNS